MQHFAKAGTNQGKQGVIIELASSLFVTDEIY